MNNNRIFEIVKEYRVRVEGLNHPVYARITKEVKEDEEDEEDRETYFGELSHYCKRTEDDATPYIPSLVKQNLYSVELIILNYLKAFTTINVVKNEYY